MDRGPGLEAALFRFDHSYAEHLEGLYAPFTPPGFPTAELVWWNEGLAAELDLADTREADFYAGNRLPPGARPLAMAYAGHQFGHLSPQLGDGRAVLLGEHLDPQGRRWDLQLKGSGRTPFSRGGDGKATLGPVLREVIVGEAMHALGVPTTRALAACTTGETVWRTEQLPGAVLTRVASSHLRVGTFEFFSVRGDNEKVERLVAYALARHAPDREGALGLLEHVAEVQAELIAHWMSLGFVHGVMNTDNFTISGETIDYGPCAFMDAYDPVTVFSSIDHQGRYAFGNQSRIGQWNLARLGEALVPQFGVEAQEGVELANAVLHRYEEQFSAAWLGRMRDKLGLDGAEDGDADLVRDLLAHLEAEGADYTSFFRELSAGLHAGNLVEPRVPADWAARWRKRLRVDAAASMDRVNPIYIPRNHLVEAALEAAIAGDLDLFEKLMDVLSRPFDGRPGLEAYARPAPEDFGHYRTFCGT